MQINFGIFESEFSDKIGVFRQNRSFSAKSEFFDKVGFFSSSVQYEEQSGSNTKIKAAKMSKSGLEFGLSDKIFFIFNKDYLLQKIEHDQLSQYQLSYCTNLSKYSKLIIRRNCFRSRSRLPSSRNFRQG